MGEDGDQTFTGAPKKPVVEPGRFTPFSRAMPICHFCDRFILFFRPACIGTQSSITNVDLASTALGSAMNTISSTPMDHEAYQKTQAQLEAIEQEIKATVDVRVDGYF